MSRVVFFITGNWQFPVTNLVDILVNMKWTTLLALTAFLMAYLCLGAWVFQTTESAYEKEMEKKVLDSYTEFIGKFGF